MIELLSTWTIVLPGKADWKTDKAFESSGSMLNLEMTTTSLAMTALV